MLAFGVPFSMLAVCIAMLNLQTLLPKNYSS
uniref:Uncharacterized protein n=1 Tax=Arundo donax TaxID=35708 RepID=A0A0A9AP06_ARUDO